MLAIQIGNRMWATEETGTNALDWMPCSGALRTIGWTLWTIRMGLRSRWRRFESCRRRRSGPGDREELPAPRDALEIVQPTVREGDARTGHEIGDRLCDQNLVRFGQRFHAGGDV